MIKPVTLPASAICDDCGAKFKKIRKHQRFCSARCRINAWRTATADPQKISEIDRRLKVVEKKLGITT